jgi:glycerol-3-phosphate acyltransferase PlsY
MAIRETSKAPAVLRRGAAHIIIGLSIGISGLFIPKIIFLSLLGAATVAFLVIEFIRFHSPAVNKWFCSFFRLVVRESEKTRLTGASYMLLAALVSFLVFARDIAATSVCFLALGDALATIIGGSNGKQGVRGKTAAGKAACLFACLAIGFILHYTGFNVSILAIVIGAIVATIMESLPKFVDDNLTIPLISGAVMTLIMLIWK